MPEIKEQCVLIFLHCLRTWGWEFLKGAPRYVAGVALEAQWIPEFSNLQEKRKLMRIKKDQEPATPTIGQCNGIFTDQAILRYFSREIARFGKDKTMRPQ